MTESLPDLPALLPSWLLALRSEGKSAATRKSYADGVRAFLSWCESTGTPPALTRTAAITFMADLLDNGAQPKTVATRLIAIKRFSAWLTVEGEYDADPLLGVKQPKLDRKVVDALTDDELRDLIKACQGKRFIDRRDEAIIRFMAETGCRAGEVIAMTTADIDLHRGIATIRRGKGGKGRIVPFGPHTATAVDRYLRARRPHVLAADGGPLWLGADNWHTFGYAALHRTLAIRAKRAGLKGFHPHLLRHTAATRWLRAKGSEGGLMAIAGWTSRDMLDRYTNASASERAVDEARGLNLGDV